MDKYILLQVPTGKENKSLNLSYVLDWKTRKAHFKIQLFVSFKAALFLLIQWEIGQKRTTLRIRNGVSGSTEK